MHGRLIWAYRNDPIVKVCIDSGASLEETIDHLARDRARLMDNFVKLKQCQLPPMLYIREPDGRITVASDLADDLAQGPSPAPRECPGHAGHCDIGGVGGSQGG